MRGFKKYVGAAVLAFLAFAPPGTMIAIFLFFAWLFGDNLPIAVTLLIISIIGAVWLFLKRKNSKNPSEKRD